MRRSSSTTSRCGASSASEATAIIGSSSVGLGALGARDQAQHAFAVVGVDHGGEEAARRLVRAGPDLVEGARDAHRLELRQLERQRLALLCRVEQPLAPVLRAFLLQHVAFVDELLEHAAERLLGDVEDVEQVGDLHARIAVDEVQHAVMGAAEAELRQHLVRIADEVAIGEEQKLDDVPDGLSGRSRPLGGVAWGVHKLGPPIYVSHVDIFWFYVTKTPVATKGSYTTVLEPGVNGFSDGAPALRPLSYRVLPGDAKCWSWRGKCAITTAKAPAADRPRRRTRRSGHEIRVKEEFHGCAVL